MWIRNAHIFLFNDGRFAQRHKLASKSTAITWSSKRITLSLKHQTYISSTQQSFLHQRYLELNCMNLKSWSVHLQWQLDLPVTCGNCFLMNSRFSCVPTVVYTVHPACKQILMAAWPTPPLPACISTESPFFIWPVINKA